MKTLSLRNKDGQTFFIKKFNGKWNIMKKDAWTNTDAFLCVGSFWMDIEPFDSMIKAYKYMKDNIEELI